jgi:sulfatase maturation enzyme AslB (radical SAM superfamily)
LQGLESVKREIDSIRSVSLHLNGGEPTLRDDIIKILRHAQARGFGEISLLTNAESFAYRGLAVQASRISNLKIITTIYGTGEAHDEISRTPGAYSRKMAGILNLQSLNVPIELRILVHKMNYRRLGDVPKALEKMGAFQRVVMLNPKLTERAYENRKDVAERLSIMTPHIEPVAQQLHAELYHFPYCMLSRELWPRSAGLTSAEPEVAFPQNCRGCSKRSGCSCIWQSYLDIFGGGEFAPL